MLYCTVLVGLGSFRKLELSRGRIASLHAHGGSPSRG